MAHKHSWKFAALTFNVFQKQVWLLFECPCGAFYNDQDLDRLKIGKPKVKPSPTHQVMALAKKVRRGVASPDA